MHRLRTAALAIVVVVSALFALAAPAWAHVTVFSSEATRGGYAVVTFRVPNEEATATSNQLVVQLPTDTPLASVGVQPIPGWTVKTTKTKLAKPITTDDGQVTEAVSQITWTASGSAAIAPGQFQQFDVQMGPLPDKASITFKALQSYSDGQVVRWIETAAPGSKTEPAHPAPVLNLAAASGGNAPSSAAPSVSATAAASPAKSGGSSNTGPVVLSIIALVLAAGALGLGIVNRARGSRSTT